MVSIILRHPIEFTTQKMKEKKEKEKENTTPTIFIVKNIFAFYVSYT